MPEQYSSLPGSASAAAPATAATVGSDLRETRTIHHHLQESGVCEKYSHLQPVDKSKARNAKEFGSQQK